MADLHLPSGAETLRILVDTYEELEVDDEATLRPNGNDGSLAPQRAKGR